MCIGTIMAPLGLILASFANEVWEIALSQGLVFGIGATFVFSPSIALPSQWFVKRKAFATGLAVSGSGIGGVCLSPMSQQLISQLGYRNALRVLGAFMFTLLTIATILANSRWKPKSNGRPWYALVDRSLLGPQFNLFLLFCLLVPFGYLAPFFLMPTYATFIGVDAVNGASLVSIMSATNAVCRVALGFLGDRYGRLNITMISTFLSGLFTMILWQFSTSYGIYVAYALLFGFSGGGFVSLIPAVTADIVGIENIQSGLGMAYAATTFANLFGTPVVGALQTQFGWTAAIQFCGALTISASAVVLVLRIVKTKGAFLAKV
ncbi:major facilitator superfamily domain-containing protein [Halteromyces radiatus]|uniref:major facilitator superfamily domain-containing protein n=1 Tax=Halteromyces radiatus TaxID=101107 RepID=UPI00221FEFD0|nr:major facilitator superfamily domain-containing protein [Halteromyces radiatus]KAI8092534.1 major facilitator superfamily domain-containing protein [Halteromyces radiatus]